MAEYIQQKKTGFLGRRKKVSVRQVTIEDEHNGVRLFINCFLLPIWSLETSRKGYEKKREAALLHKIEPLFQQEVWFEPRLAEKFKITQPLLSKELILYRIAGYLNRQALILIEREDAEEEERRIYRQLVESVYGNLNYLTIIGKDTKLYTDLFEHIYEESGLLAGCIEKPLREYPYGKEPLVLNFGSKKQVRPGCLPKGAVCLHLEGEMPKFLDTIAKNGYTNVVIGNTKMTEVHDGRKEKHINI